MKERDVQAGERFGRLTIIGESNNIGDKRAFRCECDCGVLRTLRLCSLVTSNTRSCGCLRSESTTRRNKEPERAKNIPLKNLPKGRLLIITSPS